MTLVAGIVLAILLPFVVFDVLFRPTIRRLALRNIVRRPGEAALVVVGSLLATALITASFIIGNSFGSSIRGIAVDVWGPTDELVLVDSPDDVEPTIQALAELPPDLLDGVLGAASIDVAAGSSGPNPTIEPEVQILEVDPAEAVVFTGDPDVAPRACGRPRAARGSPDRSGPGARGRRSGSPGARSPGSRPRAHNCHQTAGIGLPANLWFRCRRAGRTDRE